MRFIRRSRMRGYTVSVKYSMSNDVSHSRASFLGTGTGASSAAQPPRRGGRSGATTCRSSCRRGNRTRSRSTGNGSIGSWAGPSRLAGSARCSHGSRSRSTRPTRGNPRSLVASWSSASVESCIHSPPIRVRAVARNPSRSEPPLRTPIVTMTGQVCLLLTGTLVRHPKLCAVPKLTIDQRTERLAGPVQADFHNSCCRAQERGGFCGVVFLDIAQEQDDPIRVGQHRYRLSHH